MTPTVTFVCSICGEPSHTICVYCTKDACANHLCERCHRCSDCCECEVRLEEPLEHEHPVAEPEPVEAEAAAIETAVVEELVAAEPEASELPPPEETIPIPEPEPVVAPPEPHPDLSKLFAPEDAQARVFPTTHGPVPVSNNVPEEPPDPEEQNGSEPGT